MMVLRKNHEIATTAREKATSWLLIGAIFFAMRSCEYLHTSTEATKRTKVIRVGSVTFKKGQRIVPHADPDLHKSDLVRIRFEYQKNDRRDVYIHMFKSGDDTLCPVMAWARTVQRVRAIPGANDQSQVCLFHEESKKQSWISADYVRTRLRSIVQLIGEESLGFNKSEIGLHSIRSGGAMAMFLSGISVIVIQRVGRWSSEAFLEYIRDQVESFTAGVSKSMLTHEEFFNLSPPTPNTNLVQNVSGVNEGEDTSEDGPVMVPHNVEFSNVALSRRSDDTM